MVLIVDDDVRKKAKLRRTEPLAASATAEGVEGGEEGCPCDLATYVKDGDEAAFTTATCEADCGQQCGKQTTGVVICGFLPSYSLVFISAF